MTYGCYTSTVHGDNSKWEDSVLISTYGSHYVSLISVIILLYNRILKNGHISSGLTSLLKLAIIYSGEIFRLITPKHASTFDRLVDVKEEPIEFDDTIMIQLLKFEHDTTADLALQASCPIFEELKIDLQLLNQPAS
ncbi:hypothetical protein HD554DRAFT_2019437 [Boletus coccyginus]|nr:hypothetical protein HD554DRAFT_2019437 [Boletus coccyginus]